MWVSTPVHYRALLQSPARRPGTAQLAAWLLLPCYAAGPTLCQRPSQALRWGLEQHCCLLQPHRSFWVLTLCTAAERHHRRLIQAHWEHAPVVQHLTCSNRFTSATALTWTAVRWQSLHCKWRQHMVTAQRTALPKSPQHEPSSSRQPDINAGRTPVRGVEYYCFTCHGQKRDSAPFRRMLG